jgi:hypothetical protein
LSPQTLNKSDVNSRIIFQSYIIFYQSKKYEQNLKDKTKNPFKKEEVSQIRKQFKPDDTLSELVSETTEQDGIPDRDNHEGFWHS